MSLSESEHNASQLVSDIRRTLRGKNLTANVAWREPSVYQVHLATRHIDLWSEKLEAASDLAYIEIAAETRDDCFLALVAVGDCWQNTDGRIDRAAPTSLAKVQHVAQTRIMHGERPTRVVARTMQQSEYIDGGIPTRWHPGSDCTDDARLAPIDPKLRSIFGELSNIFAAGLEPQAAVDAIQKTLTAERIEVVADGKTLHVPEDGTVHDLDCIVAPVGGFDADQAAVDGETVDMLYDTLRLRDGQKVDLWREVGRGPHPEWRLRSTDFYSNPVHQALLRNKSVDSLPLGQQQREDAVDQQMREAPVEQEAVETGTRERPSFGKSAATDNVHKDRQRVESERERRLLERIILDRRYRDRHISIAGCCKGLDVGVALLAWDKFSRGVPVGQVVIHQADCANFAAVSKAHRAHQLVEVTWRRDPSRYNVHSSGRKGEETRSERRLRQRMILPAGFQNKLVDLPPCCEELRPGDRAIFSRVARADKVAVHHFDCHNVMAISEAIRVKKIVEVVWRPVPSRPDDLRTLEVEADDVAGVKEKISAVLASFDVDFRSWKSGSVIRFAVDVKDSQLIKKIVAELKRCKGIISAKGIASLSLGHA